MGYVVFYASQWYEADLVTVGGRRGFWVVDLNAFLPIQAVQCWHRLAAAA